MGATLSSVELSSFASAFPITPRKYLESAAYHSRQAIVLAVELADSSFNWEQIDERGRYIALVLDEGAKQGPVSDEFEDGLEDETSASSPLSKTAGEHPGAASGPAER
jgi:hypothetical protein